VKGIVAMNKFLTLLLLLPAFALPAFGQVPDATVVIHEHTLNSFFAAIGPISGKAPYEILGAHGEYTWTLRNPRIELQPGHARFIADADVRVGIFSYGSAAIGDVDIQYHPESNRISVKVRHAILEIYTKIFGKKIHITDIDVARFYKPEFEFAGPQPIQATVPVTLPDGSSKIIYIQMVRQNLDLEKERIVVTSQLLFSDRPPVPPPPQEPPPPPEHHHH
jgi:hypothetical protein